VGTNVSYSNLGEKEKEEWKECSAKHLFKRRQLTRNFPMHFRRKERKRRGRGEEGGEAALYRLVPLAVAVDFCTIPEKKKGRGEEGRKGKEDIVKLGLLLAVAGRKRFHG